MSANGTLPPSRIEQTRSPGAIRSSPELWSRRRCLRMAWTPSAKQRKCRTKICFWLVPAISPTRCRAVYKHTKYEHPSFWWKTAEASCFCQRCSFRKGTGTIWLQNPWRTQRNPNKKKKTPSLSMLTTPALTILFVSTLYIPFGSGVEFRPSFRPQFLRAGAPVLCKISSVIAETEG